MKKKSTVSYRLLVPFNGVLKKIGHIMVSTKNGDIYYTPSQAIVIKGGVAQKTIDHVSFHEFGATSVKFSDQTREELPKRGPIKEIGYQKMFEDEIFDLEKLPAHEKKVDDIDLIFDPVETPIIKMKFSIISGRVIIQNNSETITVQSKTVTDCDELLSVQTRCLGSHSGNADKLMQFSLEQMKEKPDKHPTVLRSLNVLNDLNIKRPEL